jgi:2-keto-3-deoxy-6-phosphogluconate aldolase
MISWKRRSELFATVVYMMLITASNSLIKKVLPWDNELIIPVLHNLEMIQVPKIVDALDGWSCCTVSLRHATALDSLRELAENFGPYCHIGVSTVVSESQVIFLHLVSHSFCFICPTACRTVYS